NKVIDDFSSKNIRVIFTVGKGGVGKTSIASAIAVGLSEKGHRMHSMTTDQAAHLAHTLEGSALNETRTISSIRAEIEGEKYQQEVVATAGEGLDGEGLA